MTAERKGSERDASAPQPHKSQRHAPRRPARFVFLLKLLEVADHALVVHRFLAGLGVPHLCFTP
jgi:hypothetical protein